VTVSKESKQASMQEMPVELSKELEDHVTVHAIKDGAVQGETEDEITVPATKENKQEMPTSQEPLPTLPAKMPSGKESWRMQDEVEDSQQFS
jgi:hypothetical protein